MDDPVLSSKPILERFSLEGRVALVTGGAQGIGRAFAHALAEAGAAVALVDIQFEKAETVAGELEKKGVEAIAIKADVTKRDQVEAAIQTVMKKWSKLTIGVNNAGIGQWVPSEDMSEPDWDHVLNTNLKGVFLCAQAEARVMMPQKYGKIINTASMSGSIVNTPQDQAAYNTSKAGVIHLTKSLAAEWAPDGIRVNCISPGYTRTQLVDDLLKTPVGQKVLPTWLGFTPMARMAEVTELTGAVVYLAAEVSDFMTGSDIVIDGGYCCW